MLLIKTDDDLFFDFCKNKKVKIVFLVIAQHYQRFAYIGKSIKFSYKMLREYGYIYSFIWYYYLLKKNTDQIEKVSDLDWVLCRLDKNDR